MKITIKIRNIEICIDENELDGKGSTLHYSDQAKQIQETIKVMAGECLKLHNACNS